MKQTVKGSPVWMKRARNVLLATVMGTAVLAVPVLAPHMSQGPQPAFAESDNAVQMIPISFADLVERVQPAVVSVKVRIGDPRMSSVRDDGDDKKGGEKRWDGPGGHPFDEFFRRFFDDDTPGRNPFRNRPRGRGFSASQGSGFVISADGYVVTNHHVIDNAAEIEITFDDGSVEQADVVGSDPRTDLALLKIESDREFDYVSFAEDDIRVGEWVVAVGNPFGLGGTVTAGIISARGRDIGSGPYDDYLQIDASINKGNSGGPAFNLSGEVIGVNTAIYSPSGGSVGIGFAIPASVVRDVVAELKDDGAVTRGWLGVAIQNITPDIAESLGLAEANGAIVTNVTEGSPADRAGLREADAILTVDGEIVKSSKDLARRIARLDPRDVTDIGILRNGDTQNIEVTLGTLPAPEELAGGFPIDPDNRDHGKTELVLEEMGLALAPARDIPGIGKDGVMVVDVVPGSDADRKGLKRGDIIVEVGNIRVDDLKDVERGLKEAYNDRRKAVLLRVQTGDTMRFVALPLAAG